MTSCDHVIKCDMNLWVKLITLSNHCEMFGSSFKVSVAVKAADVTRETYESLNLTWNFVYSMNWFLYQHQLIRKNPDRQKVTKTKEGEK